MLEAAFCRWTVAALRWVLLLLVLLAILRCWWSAVALLLWVWGVALWRILRLWRVTLVVLVLWRVALVAVWLLTVWIRHVDM